MHRRMSYCAHEYCITDLAKMSCVKSTKRLAAKPPWVATAQNLPNSDCCRCLTRGRIFQKKLTNQVGFERGPVRLSFEPPGVISGYTVTLQTVFSSQAVHRGRPFFLPFNRSE